MIYARNDKIIGIECTDKTNFQCILDNFLEIANVFKFSRLSCVTMIFFQLYI